MGKRLNEDQRKSLFISLLRGIANEAQDSLCASDTRHAWGPVRRFAIKHDFIPRGPVSFGAPIRDEVCWIGAERTCENCGKVERLD